MADAHTTSSPALSSENMAVEVAAIPELKTSDGFGAIDRRQLLFHRHDRRVLVAGVEKGRTGCPS